MSVDVCSLQQLCVAGMGLITPLGDEPDQVFHAVSSGLSAYAAASRKNKAGEAMTLAQVPDEALLPLTLKPKANSRQRRVVQLAKTAIVNGLKQQQPTKPMALILAGPEKTQGLKTPVDDSCLQWLAQELPDYFNLEHSYVIAEGRAGGLKALAVAEDILSQSVVREVLLVASDSLIDDKLLSLYDHEQRVLSAGTKDGFCPGEGAGALLLSLNNLTNIKAQFVSFAQAEEPGHRYSDQDYTGEALANACTALLKDIADEGELTALAGTYNGESFFAKEWGVNQIRNQKYFAENIQIVHPADCLGDLGAAAAIVQLIMFLQAYEMQQLHGALLYTASSDHALRAAVLLRN